MDKKVLPLFAINKTHIMLTSKNELIIVDLILINQQLYNI
jgi:hypothetical protein